MQLTPTAGHHESLISLLAQRWRAWKDSRDSLAGLDACGGGEVARIAHDLSLTTKELRALARQGPDAASLLYARMTDLGLDPDALASRVPMTLRDLQKDCSLCGSKRRCRHDFARGAEPSAWHGYCPNDAVLIALAPAGHGGATEAAAASSIGDDARRRHASLLALVFIGLAWVVLLAGHHAGPRRHAPAVVAPGPTGATVTCLDGSCLDAQQRAALRGLRAVQAQGWIASSAEERAMTRTASLIANDVRDGEAAACARLGGATYYGFAFQDGCSAGIGAAAKRDGYDECRPMAGGGACLLR
jgi:hypothetical protein